MLFKKMFFVLVFGGLLTMSSSTFASEGFRPADINLTVPNESVPQSCAKFFSENGWGRGAFGSGRDNELWVEKINPDCSAQVVYSFGGSGRGQPPGHLRVVDAQISDDGKLSVPLKLIYMGNEIEAVVVYRYATAHSDNRPLLFGTWSSGQNTTDVILERGVSNLPNDLTVVGVE